MLSVSQQPTTNHSSLEFFTTHTGLTEFSCLEGISFSQSICCPFPLVQIVFLQVIHLLELRVNPRLMLMIIVFNRPVLRVLLMVPVLRVLLMVFTRPGLDPSDEGVVEWQSAIYEKLEELMPGSSQEAVMTAAESARKQRYRFFE